MELDSIFKKLIKKDLVYQSDSLGLNLLISRLQRKYFANQTAEELESCLQEMKAFFEKYKMIMGKDLDKLSKLWEG
jgi:hypothetical protein